LHLNFGLPPAPTRKSPEPSPKVTVALAPAPTQPPKGIDCAMVRPVDPKFDSNMPVIAPDPKVDLPTKAVAVPSCKD
jgi:hypothetical protein